SGVVKEKKRPIIIAAAGGGIQAAAWLTFVLMQLQHADFEIDRGRPVPGSHPEPDDDQHIISNLALISSVSGGSIGALYVGSELLASKRSQTSQGTSPHAGAMQRAFRKATRSSLEDIAWQWFGAHQLGVFNRLLLDPFSDRGSVLEKRIEEV